MTATRENIRVIISGGGTGGHIFPALAIARAIEKEIPSAKILFVGAKGKMEMEKIPEAGYNIKGLWISGIQRQLSWENLSFPFKLISSLWHAYKIIKSFKPDIAIGVGGFASGPTLKMASLLNVPCLIQEQNSYPGITNKLLAKHVQKICVAYEGMDTFFPKEKITLTGNPIRKHIIDIDTKKEKSTQFFNLEADKKTILIVGGSLGAQAINNAILNHIGEWAQLDAQLIWQTGKTGIKQAQQATKDISNIKTYTFIKEMDLAYAAADLIISRAGAIAISEISAIGKPVIFVPLPTAAEDHQTKNAHKLVDKNAAILVANKDVDKELLNTTERVIHDDSTLKTMGEEIKKLGITNADEIITKEILKLIR